MLKLSASIATKLLAGVTIGITAAACIYGDLPLWIAVGVSIAVTIITILGEK